MSALMELHEHRVQDRTCENQLLVVLEKWQRKDLVSVLDALHAVRSGSVEVFIQESKVIKIEYRNNENSTSQ